MSEHDASSDPFSPAWQRANDPTATPAIAAARGRVLGLLAELSGAIADLEGVARATPPPTPDQVAALIAALGPADAGDAPAAPPADAGTATTPDGPQLTGAEWDALCGALGRLAASVDHLLKDHLLEEQLLSHSVHATILRVMRDDAALAIQAIAAVDRRGSTPEGGAP